MTGRVANQAGAISVLAIVLIVLLALVGGYLATLVGTQSLSVSQGANSMQAWFAAQAGADRAARQAVAGSCYEGTFTVPDSGGFSVTVTCSATEVTEGADTYDIFQISATASRGNPGELTYASRSVRMSVSGPVQDEDDD